MEFFDRDHLHHAAAALRREGILQVVHNEEYSQKCQSQVHVCIRYADRALQNCCHSNGEGCGAGWMTDLQNTCFRIVPTRSTGHAALGTSSDTGST